MAKLFPLEVSIGRMRGILNIIKENRGHMDLTKLAEESEIDIDSLLPLIEACDLLGFTKTVDSKIRLTKEGDSLNMRNTSKIIRGRLEAIEPFRSAMSLLSKNEMKSKELFESLNSMGFIFHGERDKNHEIMKKLFIGWGVRTKMLRYDPSCDMWSLPR